MLPEGFEEAFNEFKSVVLDKMQDANPLESDLQAAALQFLEIAKKYPPKKETDESK